MTDERLLRVLAWMDDKIQDEIDYVAEQPDESVGFMRDGTYFVVRKTDLEYALEQAEHFIQKERAR